MKSSTSIHSDVSRYYSIKSPVLLTGAGFSKPFGGYLASEMWSLIFNQRSIANSNQLRNLLLSDLSYERVYDRVSKEFGNTELTAFTEALQNAYGELDQSICTNLSNNRWHTQCIRYFVNRFMGEGPQRGFVFTLNQDLLLERYHSHEAGLVQIPGLGHPDWFNTRFGAGPAPAIEIPDTAKLDSFRHTFWSKQSGFQNLLYIKLHGSYRWASKRNKNAMVIGYEKEGSITNEPLLAWYLEIFKEVLNAPNQTLVVVGYGFMDSHINEIIATAGQKGLKLHVISPMLPGQFKDMLLPLHGNVSKPIPRGQDIWQMLHGYHCGSIDSMFPHNASALPGPTQAFLQHVGLG